MSNSNNNKPIGIFDLSTANFEIISEKILPNKIKNIIWHKTIDLIVVNCGKYYEVHRIGYKHEEIFKKEEKCEFSS